MIDYFVWKDLIILNIVPKSVDTYREPAFIDFELLYNQTSMLKNRKLPLIWLLAAILDRNENRSAIFFFSIQVTQQ